jgi:hypothetical protein
VLGAQLVDVLALSAHALAALGETCEVLQLHGALSEDAVLTEATVAMVEEVEAV